MARERWFLINTTNNPINIGDLPELPSVGVGQQIDLLAHEDRDDILASQNLIGVIRLGWARLEKELDGTVTFSASTVGQAKKFLEVTERDELEDETAGLGGGGGGGLSQEGGGTFTAAGDGDNIGGYADASSSGIVTTSDADGTLIHAHVTGAGSSITSGHPGAFIHGSAQSAGLIETTGGTYGAGQFAGGFATGTSSIIRTRNRATFAHGYAASGGQLYSRGSGGAAFGRATGASSQIYSQNAGSFASGDAQNGGTLQSTGVGSSAFGSVSGAFELTASGQGAFAVGAALGGNIQATYSPSFAGGWANAGNIVASAQGAFQWGEGTNNIANSLAVGADGTGLHFHADGAPTTPQNGDMWVASNNVYVHTGGVTKNMSNIT